MNIVIHIALIFLSVVLSKIISEVTSIDSSIIILWLIYLISLLKLYIERSDKDQSNLKVFRSVLALSVLTIIFTVFEMH